MILCFFFFLLLLFLVWINGLRGRLNGVEYLADSPSAYRADGHQALPTPFRLYCRPSTLGANHFPDTLLYESGVTLDHTMLFQEALAFRSTFVPLSGAPRERERLYHLMELYYRWCQWT